MDEPEAYKNLINLGLEDFNMFHSAILLHNESLLGLNNNMKSGLKIGQTLGSLDLGGLMSNKSSHFSQIL